MAANDTIAGSVLFAVEDAQKGQTLVHGGVPTQLLSVTTFNQVPYFMAPGAGRYFAAPSGTQVFAVPKVIVPPQGWLLLKVIANTGSKTLDSVGSTAGFVRITVLEQDLSDPSKDPITRVIREFDRDTARLPDDPAFSASTTTPQEAYAFQPGNGRAWVSSGPQNLDLRTTA